MFDAWKRIRAQWPQSAKTRLAQGLAQHRAAVQARPGEYRADFNRFMRHITRGHARLEEMRPHVESGLVDRAKFDLLNQRYEVLAAGVFSDAAQVDAPELAGAFVPVFVVAGIAFTIVAVVWAVVAYQEASAFDNQTELMRDELAARIHAGNNGTTLQPTTLPDRPAPGNGGSGDDEGMGVLVAGGLATLLMAGGGFMLWQATKKGT